MFVAVTHASRHCVAERLDHYGVQTGDRVGTEFCLTSRPRLISKFRIQKNVTVKLTAHA
jgi:hypothetical protein